MASRPPGSRAASGSACAARCGSAAWARAARLTSASLVALALGALLLPRVLPRDARGVAFALALASLGLAWPFVAPRFVPAGANGEWETFVGACVLVGPPLVGLGALVPLVHRCVDGPRGALLGRLLLHEIWGIGLGLPLAHLVIVPRFGLEGALGWCALLAIACAAVLVPLRHAHFAAVGAVFLSLPALACAFFATAPARQSPPYAEPALQLLSLREDRDFAVAVVDDGLRGERTLLTDGFRAAGTGDDYRYMRVLGHLPVLLHPKPERVAVLALGTGTTLGAVALHPDVQHIDVLEISRAVVAAAPFFEATNHGVLGGSDARVVVRLGDGRRTLADRTGEYDVVTMEPLLPDAPFGVYLYTREFYAHAARALRPGGILCQWVPPHALEPATFEAVLDAFARGFAWSGVWLAGTQVVLVGSSSAPRLDARRFEGPEALRAALRDTGLADAAGVARATSDPCRAARHTRANSPMPIRGSSTGSGGAARCCSGDLPTTSNACARRANCRRRGSRDRSGATLLARRDRGAATPRGARRARRSACASSRPRVRPIRRRSSRARWSARGVSHRPIQVRELRAQARVPLHAAPRRERAASAR